MVLTYTNGVTTAKAIEALRKKLGDSQKIFAKRLGTTITTISRYENGRIEPSEGVLDNLATLAREASQDHLAVFFQGQRRASIVTRVGKLPSPGTQRRVSQDDLKYTAAVARYVAKEIKTLGGRIMEDAPPKADLYISAITNALYYLERQNEEIEVHIAEPWSGTRAEEDKRLLLRQSTSAYGLQGKPNDKS